MVWEVVRVDRKMQRMKKWEKIDKSEYNRWYKKVKKRRFRVIDKRMGGE